MTSERQAEGWQAGAEFETEPRSEVLIIDVGAQYRRRFYWELAEQGVRADMISYVGDPKNPDIVPHLDVDWIKQNYSAVHITGGGGSVDDGNTPPLPPELLDGSIAVWGNCLGAQMIAQTLGGQVGKHDEAGNPLAEFGRRTVDVVSDSNIFGDTPTAEVHMSHGYGILAVPAGCTTTSFSGQQVASFESADGKIVATLFHPEVKDTLGGSEMMARFRSAAGVEADADYGLEKALAEYMDKEEAVIAEKLTAGARIEGFVSGGIDSMVAAMAVVKVARELDRLDQVRFTYVDNGHMRIEDDQVIDFATAQGIPIRKIDASERFFTERVELINEATGEVWLAKPLPEEADPEIRRAIQGIIFAGIATEIIDEVRQESGGDVYFIQGSNESDAVSSGRGGSKKIKSHHNIKFMEPLREAGLLIEPLLGIYKHHIRQQAETRYDLPEDIAKRQPFPGPGLGPRIVVNLSGELLPTEAAQQRQLDELAEDLSHGKLHAHLVRSSAKYVGNKGDARCEGDGVFIDGRVNDWR